MELLVLQSCEIYCDGGSLEGAWTTTEGEEWAVCLRVNSTWDKPKEFENRSFKLYNCSLHNTGNSTPIEKDRKACHGIIALIDQWLVDKNRSIVRSLQDRMSYGLMTWLQP